MPQPDTLSQHQWLSAAVKLAEETLESVKSDANTRVLRAEENLRMHKRRLNEYEARHER